MEPLGLLSGIEPCGEIFRFGVCHRGASAMKPSNEQELRHLDERSCEGKLCEEHLV